MISAAVSPPAVAGLIHAGRYRRRMAVSLERMYENALDWAHLPHLHSGSFSEIKCLSAGGWGWQARARLAATDTDIDEGQSPGWLGPVLKSLALKPVQTIRYLGTLAEQQRASREGAEVLLELLLEKDHRQWITTTQEGPGAGNQVWTRVIEHGPRDIEVVVDFMLADAPPALAKVIGDYFIVLYRQLYDEDESMMLARQQALDELKSSTKAGVGSEPVLLGPKAEVRASLPRQIDYAGRSWRVVSVQQQLVAHTLHCPHMLRPLDDAAVSEAGTVTCPWHGYRFDVLTGNNLDGHACRMPKAPAITVDETGSVWLG